MTDESTGTDQVRTHARQSEPRPLTGPMWVMFVRALDAERARRRALDEEEKQA